MTEALSLVPPLKRFFLLKFEGDALNWMDFIPVLQFVIVHWKSCFYVRVTSFRIELVNWGGSGPVDVSLVYYFTSLGFDSRAIHKIKVWVPKRQYPNGSNGRLERSAGHTQHSLFIENGSKQESVPRCLLSCQRSFSLRLLLSRSSAETLRPFLGRSFTRATLIVKSGYVPNVIYILCKSWCRPTS